MTTSTPNTQADFAATRTSFADCKIETSRTAPTFAESFLEDEHYLRDVARVSDDECFFCAMGRIHREAMAEEVVG